MEACNGEFGTREKPGTLHYGLARANGSRVNGGVVMEQIGRNNHQPCSDFLMYHSGRFPTAEAAFQNLSAARCKHI